MDFPTDRLNQRVGFDFCCIKGTDTLYFSLQGYQNPRKYLAKNSYLNRLNSVI